LFIGLSFICVLHIQNTGSNSKTQTNAYSMKAEKEIKWNKSQAGGQQTD
jgi:hypothetical protein